MSHLEIGGAYALVLLRAWEARYIAELCVDPDVGRRFGCCETVCAVARPDARVGYRARVLPAVYYPLLSFFAARSAK